MISEQGEEWELSNQTCAPYFNVLLCKQSFGWNLPITANPQEYSVSMKEITVVEISGNLLILAQRRVKYINI